MSKRVYPQPTTTMTFKQTRRERLGLWLFSKALTIGAPVFANPKPTLGGMFRLTISTPLLKLATRLLRRNDTNSP